MERFYDKISYLYDGIYSDALFKEARKEAVQELLGAEPKKESQKILEIGVGTGLSLQFYPSECLINGIDLSGPMLKKAEKLLKTIGHKNCQLKKMNAIALEFDDNYFDGVLGSLFISATSNRRRAVNEMQRVCRPEGRIVLMNHFRSKNALVARLEDLFNPITEKLLGFRANLDFDSFVEQCGLELEHSRPVGFLGYWTLAVFKNRKGQRTSAGQIISSAET